MFKITTVKRFNPDRIREKVLKKADKDAKKAAEFVVKRTIVYCPVDSGAMKRSIHLLPGPTLGIYFVIVEVPYAGLVEFGHMSSKGKWIAPVYFLRRAIKEGELEYPTIARVEKIEWSREGIGMALSYAIDSY